MHVDSHRVAVICGVLLAAAGGGAVAAGATETVVVTATRTEQPSFETPAAIDAISGEDLRLHRMRVDLSEGLGRIPGIVVHNRYNYAQDLQVSSRGFGARASFGVRGVRLLQDGIPLTMPDGQGQTGLFDLDAADKVEVLRGPFAALYGNSSGGVIQLVTTANPPATELELSTTAAEEGLWRYGLQIGAPVGDLGVRLNVSRFTTDGFREHSAARRDVANLKLRYAPDENTAITLIANILDQPDTQDPLGLTREQLEADPEQAGTNAVALDTRKSIRHNQGGIAWERRLSERNRLRVLGYYGDRDLTQFLANPSPALTGSGGVVNLARRFGGAGVQWDHVGTAGGGTYELTLGVEYDRMKERRRGFVNVAGTVGELRRDEDDTVYSVNQYLIAEWDPGGRWRFAGGLRHSDVRFRAEDYFIVGPNPDDSGRLRYDSTQPVFGVLYELTPSVNLFASGGRAFETPTFAELAYRPDGTPGFNFDLDAAISTNYETGAKFRFGERTEATATLFRSDTEQDIVTGPSPFPGRNTFVNAARTRREGAELALETEGFAGLDLFLAYTYTRARFDEFVNFAGLDLSGRRLPGVPEHSAYGELVWRHGSGIVAGLEARWVGKVYVDDANSEFADEYAVLNLHAGLSQRIGGWELSEFLRVDNVTDEDYVGSVVVNAVNGRFFEPAPGRTFYLGIVARNVR